MRRQINKVAVLGSGVMGMGIAAHLANAGIPSLVLDIVPRYTDKEKKAGLKEDSKAFRNKLGNDALQAALKSRPAAFYSPKFARRIEIGNFDDDLPRIKECDWIIEVVIENMEIKKGLYKKVAEHRKKGTIVSSNTSGLSINEMAAGLDDEFCQHMMGTHFFNPARYMRLLEIIPHKKTKQEVLNFMADFCENRLGKGVVWCKDTPNFIANRLGIYGMVRTYRAMAEHDLTIDAVNQISGPPMGLPRAGSFRTADLVGLDVLVHVCDNLFDAVTKDECRDEFKLPGFVRKMVENKWLGDKTKQGFYKKEKSPSGERQKFTLDWKTLEYKPSEKVKLDSIKAVKDIEDPAARVKKFAEFDDVGGRFAWDVMADSFIYAANRVPEIADTIIECDRAMRWGFNRDLGPFETWDALGLEATVKRMQAEKRPVPQNIKDMLAAGASSFYKKQNGKLVQWDLVNKKYIPVPVSEKVINLPDLREEKKLIEQGIEASIYDIGEQVLCIEFHCKMNAIGPDMVKMLGRAVDMMEEGDWRGLVIANHADNFSVGANLMLVVMAANQKEFDQIEQMSRNLQQACLRLRTSSKPVVAAPAGMALGGGLEICLGADKVAACGETYAGLVEVGVGLLPGGGGCKELAMRAVEYLPDNLPMAVQLLPFIARAFQNIAMAKVATSAVEAQDFGFFRPSDRVVTNRGNLIYEARQTVIGMVNQGYVGMPERTDVSVAGTAGIAALELMVEGLVKAGYASEHDALISRKIAHVVCGGHLKPGTKVSESYLLDLEREAFVSLVGEPKTIERMQYMLMNNKPLRN
jgi:3-hydroxyacyl-CoA dehydrogenase